MPSDLLSARPAEAWRLHREIVDKWIAAWRDNPRRGEMNHMRDAYVEFAAEAERRASAAQRAADRAAVLEEVDASIEASHANCTRAPGMYALRERLIERLGGAQ